MSTENTLRRPLAALGAAIAMLAALLALPGASANAAAPATCPKFHVEHNDTIGPLKLKAGYYTVKIRDDRLLSCPQTTSLLQQFLQDYDGKLGNGWKVKPKAQGFKNRRTGAFFKLTNRSNNPSGGGGGGSTPHLKCPSTFRVQNNDRIGKLRLPAGNYTTHRLNKQSPDCQRVSRLFAKFLQRPDGDLPNRWKVKAKTGKFVKGGGDNRIGFRVKPAR